MNSIVTGQTCTSRTSPLARRFQKTRAYAAILVMTLFVAVGGSMISPKSAHAGIESPETSPYICGEFHCELVAAGFSSLTACGHFATYSFRQGWANPRPAWDCHLTQNRHYNFWANAGP